MSANDHNRPPAKEDPGETRAWVLAFRRGFTPLFSSVKRILWLLYAVCAAFVLLDLVFLFGWADKEAHYGWENMVGFYSAYGFVSCVLLVFVAKYLLRPAVIRSEKYYDKPSENRD
jgi:hypothetical protein